MSLSFCYPPDQESLPSSNFREWRGPPFSLFRKDTKSLAEKIAIEAGCKTTTSAVMVHCLRQKTEEELMEVTLKMKFMALDLVGDPKESSTFLTTVIDGVLLPKAPAEILAEKKYNMLPYMVGINQQEFGWIIPTMLGYPLSEGKLDQKTATELLWKSYPIVNVSKELTPVATEKYLGGTDDPVKRKICSWTCLQICYLVSHL